MSLFLRAQHWQLFTGYCSPLIIQMILGSMVNNEYFFFPVIFLACLALFIFFCWNWTVALDISTSESKSAKTFYKISFFSPIIYLGILVVTLILDNGYFRISNLLLPHLASMIAVFYCYYYAARSMVQACKTYGIDIESVFIVVLAILFFPIGIWYLQPKVNAIARVINGERV